MVDGLQLIKITKRIYSFAIEDPNDPHPLFKSMELAKPSKLRSFTPTVSLFTPKVSGSGLCRKWYNVLSSSVLVPLIIRSLRRQRNQSPSPSISAVTKGSMRVDYRILSIPEGLT